MQTSRDTEPSPATVLKFSVESIVSNKVNAKPESGKPFHLLQRCHAQEQSGLLLMDVYHSFTINPSLSLLMVMPAISISEISTLFSLDESLNQLPPVSS